MNARSALVRSFQELDRIIRGEATHPSALREVGNIDISVGNTSGLILGLGLIYGVCIGTFALFKESGPNVVQMIASAIKIPLLMFLTLIVTFPSLYVFNAIVGSRLSLTTVLRLLIAALAVLGALLASFGPIVAFFSASTSNYRFMQLLNVLVFAVAGFLCLHYLLITLHRLTVAITPTPEPEIAPVPAPEPNNPPDDSLLSTPMAPVPPVPQTRRTGDLLRNSRPGALDPTGETVGRDVITVFRIWTLVFGLVGAQMAWVLRPIVGSPDIPFTWFRPRDSNFFEAVWKMLWGV